MRTTCRRSCIPATPRRSGSCAESMLQPRGLLLGDALRPRLLDPAPTTSRTTVHLPPALATGKLRHRLQCHGARGDAGRRTARPTACASSTRPAARIAASRARGGAGRQRLRIGADPAQLQIHAVPDGLANSSGLVGKYLMDTVGADLSGQIPLLENLPPHNEDGADGGHMYSPWWLYKEQLAGKLGFRARLSHRVRRRPGHARRWTPAPGSSGSPAAATARSSRKTRGATTARSSASPAAAR